MLDELLHHEKPPDVRWVRAENPLRLNPALKFKTLKSTMLYAIFWLRKKLRTVSLGWAPQPSQYFTRSASSLTI
ncbi:MAG TPA: hypothetical protein VMV59_07790, partial [Candidatus Dormibacteraeota bacterium]|nr:hypothetical protein [Candidatus Dormibacteraeota bacterium]